MHKMKKGQPRIVSNYQSEIQTLSSARNKTVKHLLKAQSFQKSFNSPKNISAKLISDFKPSQTKTSTSRGNTAVIMTERTHHNRNLTGSDVANNST